MRTVEEVSAMLGISVGRVKAIESKAMRKLRYEITQMSETDPVWAEILKDIFNVSKANM